MPYKVIEQRDFGGGLNTAVDTTLIRPNESPSMLNVDVTDTNAITRRKGYATITGTPVAGSSVRDLYRYYRADGTKYWVAIAGTHLYSAQDTATQVPLTRVEAESVPVTSLLAYSSNAFSGGGACVVAPSVAATLEVPLSSQVSVRLFTCGSDVPTEHPAEGFSPAFVSSVMQFAPTLTASLKVDGGAYSNITITASQGYTYSGALAATHHTIVLKTPAATENVVQDSSPRIAYSGSVKPVASELWWGGTGVILESGGSATLTFYGTRFKWYTRKAKPNGKARVSIDSASPVTVDAYASATSYGDLMWDSGALAYGRHTITIEWTGQKNTAATGYDVPIDYFRVTEGGVAVDYFDYSALNDFTRYGTALSATANATGLSTLNNLLHYSTGYDDVRSFNGATTAAISASGTTKGAHLAQLKRRLFAGGIATDQALMNYTEIDEGHNWTDGGVARLAGLDSGGDCTGIAVFDDKLFWFGESRLYGLLTNGTEDNWQSYTISQTHGCIAPRSLAVAPNALIFLSADGVRAYGPVPNIFNADGSDTLPLSININPTLDAYTDAQKRAAMGAVYRNRYWLVIGSDLFVADLVQRTANKQPVWVKYAYDGLTITSLCVTRGDEYGLYAGGSDGRIYRLDIGDTDNGDLIPMSYTMAPIAPGGFQSIKHFRTMHLAVDSPSTQTLTVTPVTDDVAGAASTLTVTGGSDARPLRVPMTARGRFIQPTFSSDGANQPITISSVALTFTPPRMR